MLHFTFFRTKMARENFIQTAHFNNAKNKQILYKCTPCCVEDPFINGSLANRLLDCWLPFDKPAE